MSRSASRMIKTLALIALGAAADAGAMSCVVESAPQFVFGQYDPQSAIALDIQTSFAVQCTPAFRGEQLNLQIGFSGLAAGQLSMRNPASGEVLSFAMYRDPARAQPIDAQSVLSFHTPLLTTTTLSLPVYGRIPARQNVSVGHYQLGVTVLLSF